MSKQQLKRMAKLLEELSQQGIRFLAREFTIFFPYGQDPKAVSPIKSLMEEFHFAIQFEIV